MKRSELLTMMCSRADGSVDEARLEALRNRWSPQARAASLGVRFAKYGSGFAPAARAAAAAAAKARGGIPGAGVTVMAPGGRGGFIAAGGQAPGTVARPGVPVKVMAPGGRGGFIEAGGQAPKAVGGIVGAGKRGPTSAVTGAVVGPPPSAASKATPLPTRPGLVPAGGDGLVRRTPGDNLGFWPSGSGAVDVNGRPVGSSMRGDYSPNPGSSVPGPGAAALEGQQYRINGKLYYVKDGVLTKAWSDGGTQAKQGGRGGKSLPMPTSGMETARNLEILRKAGVVLPDGSGGATKDDRRRY